MIEQLTKKQIKSSSILIIDDSRLNRTILQRIFTKHHYHQLFFAEDGEEGLKQTKEHEPHLIILDLLMPNMDGYEFCRRLREMPHYKETPILVQTAISEAEERNRIFELGATDLVTKPANPQELMARVKIRLEKLYLVQSLQEYQQRVAAELEEAEAMQQELLPKRHQLDIIREHYQIDIADYYEKSSELGGDVWGVTPCGTDEVALHITDFSGHGVTAALNVFRLHTMMKERISDLGATPGERLTKLNQYLYPLLSNSQFATMFYGVINTRTNTLRYATAATPHPILFQRSTGKIMLLDGTGFPIAACALTTYDTKEIPFHQGDLLML